MDTVLHKQDTDFAIVTTAENERDFRAQLAAAFASAIEGGEYDGDWAFNLDGWLEPAIEIVCSYRGYKATVVKKSTIIAGTLDPDAAVIRIGRHAEDPVIA